MSLISAQFLNPLRGAERFLMGFLDSSAMCSIIPFSVSLIGQVLISFPPFYFWISFAEILAIKMGPSM